jgi:hypothetical protein
MCDEKKVRMKPYTDETSTINSQKLQKDKTFGSYL